MQRRTALVLIACAIVFSASGRSVHAQDFSGKPIRLLVGLAAGGATDVMARLVAQKMSENLRTTVFVENDILPLRWEKVADYKVTGQEGGRIGAAALRWQRTIHRGACRPGQTARL